MTQSIAQDIADLKKSALSSYTLAVKLVQIDPNDTQAQEAIKFYGKILKR